MKNICLVGIGGYAARCLKIIQLLEKERSISLHSIVVRDRKKYAKEVEEVDNMGVIIYPSFEKMLTYGQNKVDIIVLPIALMDLASHSIMALEAGYDVIAEKPAAVTIQDADKLIEVEKATDQYLCIGYQFTYSSSISLILNTIESGQLGKVKHVKVMCGWSRNWKYYKSKNWIGKLSLDNKWILDGPLANENSHFLNNALMIVSAANHAADIKSLKAELYRANNITSYDVCSLRAEMEDGVQLFFVASHAINNSIDPIMEVECENGSINWNFENEKTVIRYKDGHKKLFREQDIEQKYENVFRDAIAVSTTRTRRPKSTMEVARPQVLVSNLAFESAQEIVTIPEKSLKYVNNKQGKKTTVIDMESILEQAYQNKSLFSEMNLPWAKETAEVSGNGYTHFPQNEKLLRLLK